MAKLPWYWHRLRAMSPGEVSLHVRKKWRQAADAKRTAWPELNLASSGVFPKLPKPEDAPPVLREALKRDTENILAGRWKFFGHLELQVDAPPKWQYDYLVRRDVETTASGFKLDYRALGDGVDSKVIWEPNRWHPLVRLAMAACVLGDRRAGEKCVEWLEDWVKHNPPYRGWNWTSALEVGMRLVQFTWMDALLSRSSRGDEAQTSIRVSNTSDQSLLTSAATMEKRLERLRQQILPPHVWYAWRHKSFGSSANNHLIGELAGLILATVRWPALAQCGASLDGLQAHWENEVLAQFAEDGGNKEQALNYHLFSWEFCWQARMALVAAGREISAAVGERLRRAAQFFVDVQVPTDPWDYGDSDDAFVTPLFANEAQAVAESHEWFREPTRSPALEFWMSGARRGLRFEISDSKEGEWRYLQASGYAMRREGDWSLRWDLSTLGLGTMAAHGHLDVLQVSLWLRGVAMVIDPGTGAYHADRQLRGHLASRTAHNGPAPDEKWTLPVRLGPFLWDSRHRDAVLTASEDRCDWGVADHEFSRAARFEGGTKNITIRDAVSFTGPHGDFSVRWQFAPETHVENMGKRRFRVSRRGVSMEVQVSADWTEVFCVTDQRQVAESDPDAPLAGTVSPAFRKTVWAPYLKLVARPRGDNPCVFTTTFLASAH